MAVLYISALESWVLKDVLPNTLTLKQTEKVRWKICSFWASLCSHLKKTLTFSCPSDTMRSGFRLILVQPCSRTSNRPSTDGQTTSQSQSDCHLTMQEARRRAGLNVSQDPVPLPVKKKQTFLNKGFAYCMCRQPITRANWELTFSKNSGVLAMFLKMKQISVSLSTTSGCAR